MRNRASIPTKEEISRAAAALSASGASKGGQARAAALLPKKRSAIAKKAAQTRWAKKSPETGE